jgi:hypothetical protein
VNNFCRAPKHTYTSWVYTKFYYIHKDTLLYQLIVITTSTDAPATSVLDHSTYTIIIFIINTHKQTFSVYHMFKSIVCRPRKPSLILYWINIVYFIFSCNYCSLNSITHSTIISQTIPNSYTIRIWPNVATKKYYKSPSRLVRHGYHSFWNNVIDASYESSRQSG